jgi:hypothetical protein
MRLARMSLDHLTSVDHPSISMISRIQNVSATPPEPRRSHQILCLLFTFAFVIFIPFMSLCRLTPVDSSGPKK